MRAAAPARFNRKWESAVIASWRLGIFRVSGKEYAT